MRPTASVAAVARAGRLARATARAGVLARMRRLAARYRLVGYLFILPWFIGFLWLTVYPFVAGLYLSLTDYSLGRRLPQWVGLANYAHMFRDEPLFGLTLYNTLYYLALQVPPMLVLSFALALLLNARLRSAIAFRTIYYVPTVVPGVAAAVLWVWLLDARRGLVNQLLGLLGVSPIHWLTSPDWTKPALIIASLWGLGGQMVIFLAGLQGIAQDYYEAAAIDGAGPLRRMRHITLPLMTPTIFFNLVMGIIAAFQVFGSAFIMIGPGGGPLNSALFYMILIYQRAFHHFRMGYAAALSNILFLIILALTLVVNATSQRWVHYE